MSRITIGILAHVDAGKTTLSEAMLYTSGKIRKLGRVDNKNAYLDTNALEKQRGITIFSKQAEFSIGDLDITLLDSPGHMDFSAEMERILHVLDYAILVINGASGVQSHTQTLWKLLKRYNIPTFIFVNKMDQNVPEKRGILKDLCEEFNAVCVDFSDDTSQEFFESIAMTDERILEYYLENGELSQDLIRALIRQRKIFPCCFGSALKLDGVEEFMTIFKEYVSIPEYGDEFGAKIFKIARDDAGNRLTYMKIVGGSLKAKDIFKGSDNGEIWEEKVNQLRIYSGTKFEVVGEVKAGEVCAVTGLNRTKALDCVGVCEDTIAPVLEPVLTYRMILPKEIDAKQMLPKVRILEEELPELHVLWNEELKEIQVQIMGEVQIEILQSLIQERFGVYVEFGEGNIVYKETIANVVEGVGHFEPLRHYAEVHLKMEPGPRGSGITVASECSEDILSKNWQRLIITHILEREHVGVLTGSTITDVKFTIVAGRAHQKHTEGGDFRQATYRAIRQGLMMADSVLLEPYYEFTLEIPSTMIGRAMNDIDRMQGKLNPPETVGNFSILTGTAPVATMRSYHRDVVNYTKGEGRLNLNFSGYEKCHNSQEVVESIGYDPLNDLANPTGSVFCAHGAGFLVPYNEVYNYMHVESGLGEKSIVEEYVPVNRHSIYEEKWIDIDEIDAILERATNANSAPKKKPGYAKTKVKRVAESMGKVSHKPQQQLEKYVLVDGYNVVFAWDELKELSKANIDSAREKLMDILCNYQGAKKCNLIVVFDAYKTSAPERIYNYHNIHVVFTKEAETADAYIEKFAHENAKKYDITVVTSDGLEQIIIRGEGCKLISAREFEIEVKNINKELKENYVNSMEDKTKTYLLDGIDISVN